MEGSISFWGYKEQESNLILPEHDDDDKQSNAVIKSGNKMCCQISDRSVRFKQNTI
jgi:hypothetical protein